MSNTYNRSKLIGILTGTMYVLCSLALSVSLSWVLAERVFFDQLLYGKSKMYGYAPFGNTHPHDFGERSRVVRSLYADRKNPASVLGDTTDDLYTVAVIGDSYVWGLGVRQDQTLPFVLEQKLNTFRPSRVLALGAMGDDAIDNYAKYTSITQQTEIDLVVFLPVDNDIVFNEYRKYTHDPFYELRDECVRTYHGEPILNVSPKRDDYLDVLEDDEYPERIYSQAWMNPVNNCMLRNIIARYPKQNVLYFIADSYDAAEHINDYVALLKEQGLTIITADEGRNKSAYTKYWKNPTTHFHVSRKEHHPSALAHRMFAEVLYEAITSHADRTTLQ